MDKFAFLHHAYQAHPIDHAIALGAKSRTFQFEKLKNFSIIELIHLYWGLGKDIVEKQEKEGWGSNEGILSGLFKLSNSC